MRLTGWSGVCLYKVAPEGEAVPWRLPQSLGKTRIVTDGICCIAVLPCSCTEQKALQVRLSQWQLRCGR